MLKIFATALIAITAFGVQVQNGSLVQADVDALQISDGTCKTSLTEFLEQFPVDSNGLLTAATWTYMSGATQKNVDFSNIYSLRAIGSSRTTLKDAICTNKGCDLGTILCSRLTGKIKDWKIALASKVKKDKIEQAAKVRDADIAPLKIVFDAKIAEIDKIWDEQMASAKAAWDKETENISEYDTVGDDQAYRRFTEAK